MIVNPYPDITTSLSWIAFLNKNYKKSKYALIYRRMIMREEVITQTMMQIRLNDDEIIFENSELVKDSDC
jgi:hypothetical protein